MMMTIKLYTDKELIELRNMRKRVTNPGAHWLEKPSRKPVHRQRSFKVRSEQNENLFAGGVEVEVAVEVEDEVEVEVAGEVEPVHWFEIYQRQNIRDNRDFSCGIAYLPHGGSRLTLARYNGPSHQHEDIEYRTHIHHATARAIEAGKRPEREAKETDRYETIDGALACLIKDFNLTGVDAQFDQPRLF